MELAGFIGYCGFITDICMQCVFALLKLSGCDQCGSQLPFAFGKSCAVFVGSMMTAGLLAKLMPASSMKAYFN